MEIIKTNDIKISDEPTEECLMCGNVKGCIEVGAVKIPEAVCCQCNREFLVCLNCPHYEDCFENIGLTKKEIEKLKFIPQEFYDLVVSFIEKAYNNLEAEETSPGSIDLVDVREWVANSIKTFYQYIWIMNESKKE